MARAGCGIISSPTDDPAEIRTLDVVRAAERGRLVMTNGPFLEVTLRAGRNGSAAAAGPGEDLSAPGREATLHVRVQCPNWFDVDRVQVFVNGRPVESLNFTRKQTADRFASTTVKFDQELPLRLASDAHVIVAAIGEGSKLGAVMGPEHAGRPSRGGVEPDLRGRGRWRLQGKWRSARQSSGQRRPLTHGDSWSRSSAIGHSGSPHPVALF
jgi:hypothetical protein